MAGVTAGAVCLINIITRSWTAGAFGQGSTSLVICWFSELGLCALEAKCAQVGPEPLFLTAKGWRKEEEGRKEGKRNQLPTLYTSYL